MSFARRPRVSKRGKQQRNSLRFGSTTLIGSTLLLTTVPLYAAEGDAAVEPPSEPTTTSIRVAEANPEANPEPASAGDQVLAEVVVHARNRLEPLKDVPLSISVVTGGELQRLQAEDLGAITRRAANVSWNQGNQRTSSVSIRGVGKVGQTEAQDPSVGIIVDGVSYAYNPLSSSYNFVDVDSVEVTRGPQGTLMGKSASLGVISIRTRRPTFEPTADYSVSYGDNDALHGWFAGGNAIIDDKLAARATLSFDKAQGDIGNRYNPDNTYQNKDRVAGRLQFLYTPTDTFSARLSLDAQPRAGENTNGRTFYTPTPAFYADGVTPVNQNSEAATRLNRRWFTQNGYSYGNDYLYSAGDTDVYNDAQQPVVTGTNGAGLELGWTVGNLDLTSISGYRDYHFNAHNNDEGTPFDIQRSSGQEIYYSQVSQELRVNSHIGDIADYQTGIYLLKTETDIRRNVILGADAGAWFATPTQYAALDADGAGRYLMQNSLDKVWKNENLQRVENKSAALFGQANWHITPTVTVTTGLRFTREDRTNPGSSLIYNNGNGAELNAYEVNGVRLGGFDTVASGALGTVGQLTTASAADPAQVAIANFVAQKYFNVPTYAQLTDLQRRQVAYAKAIRQTRLGVLWNYSEPEPYKATQPAWVISPSYKISNNVTTYTSWQYGEKAGISQQVNGRSFLADAEKSNAYEWGIKTILLNNTLTLNFDLFQTEIENYQQGVQVFDEYTTTLRNDGTLYYTASTGNAPKVEVKGMEIDGVYAGLPYTTLRFSGAYNDAKYKEFKFSGLPAELGNLTTPYRDVSGETLAGAPKYAFNIGADFRIPVLGRYEFHSSANWAYSSKFNSDNTLSSYGWVPASSLVDLAVGLGTDDGRYDISFLAKNVFDDDTPLARTWNNFTPATSRWLGVMVSGKLF